MKIGRICFAAMVLVLAACSRDTSRPSPPTRSTSNYNVRIGRGAERVLGRGGAHFSLVSLGHDEDVVLGVDPSHDQHIAKPAQELRIRVAGTHFDLYQCQAFVLDISMVDAELQRPVALMVRAADNDTCIVDMK